MMMHTAEFLTQTRLDATSLDTWVKEGWLRPSSRNRSFDFSEVDMARAQLIQDLRRDLGVNDEAIPIILDLIDQVHGLRRLLRGLVGERGA
jgi:chaperone modulatory protein CbpM